MAHSVLDSKISEWMLNFHCSEATEEQQYSPMNSFQRNDLPV
jgi:hypothetical protein